MGILQNYEAGAMDRLRSISYKETGTEAPYVEKSEGSTSNQITKRIDDTSRIAQLLVDKPGVKFLANEAILKQGELTKKLEGNNGTAAGNIIRRVGGTVKHVAQVAGSTLAQVPVNGTGTHFLRGFRTDTYLQDGDPSSGFAEFFGAGGVEGSKYAIRGERIPVQGTLTDSKLPARNTTANPGDIGKYHVGIEGNLTTEDNDPKYTSDTPFTEAGTVDNVNNVKNGKSTAKPVDLLRNTTLEAGSLGVTNKDVEGDVTENTFVAKEKFRPDTPYTETTTTDNINNANSGNPIKGPTGTGLLDQTFSIQTTARPKDLGVSNKGIKGDIATEDKTDKFNKDATYTRTDTKGNIGSIQSDKNFSTDGSIPLRDNRKYDTIAGSSTSIEQTKQDQDIYSGNLGNTSLGSGKQIQDFRSKDSKNNFNGGTSNTYSFNYNSREINKEVRVGLGNQGKISRNRTSYNISDPDTVDKINKLDVSKKPLNGVTENRDLIQLEFQVMTPDDTYYLAFRAFLDTFDDSFNGSWNSNKYLGRADSFYTYSGFERTINIGFKIAAATKEEMKPLYRKAATLASVTAPTYGDNGRFMRGSLAKVTVGDYIYEQPGIIESVNYSWQKEYPWEISFQNPEQKDDVQILPHVLDVTISFKVIHDFLPQTGITPLITNYRPISANKQTYIDLPKEIVKGETDKEAEVRKAKENSTSITPPPVSSELEGNPNTFPFANN